MSIDVLLFEKLFAFSKNYPQIGQLFVEITNLSSVIFAVIYICVILLLGWQKNSKIIPFLVGPAISLLSVELIRMIYSRPRPFVALDIESLVQHDPTGSFPSRHAVSAFAIATSVWFVNRLPGKYLFGLALLTAFSRVMVGVHFPLDIISGGVIAFLLCAGVYKLFTAQVNQKQSKGAENE